MSRRIARLVRPLGSASTLLLLAALAATPETHRDLQSVHPDGTSAWSGSLPFTLRGVLLNDPEECLDATPNFVPWDEGAGAGQMGGEWQIFLQAADSDDRGGTTCWMGQNYGNLPWLRDSAKSYSNEAWAAETQRLSRDPVHHHRFRKGDLVEVTARRSLFYGGKRNINEAHDRNSEVDFTLTLVRADHGLPAPELITLADLVRPDDGDPTTQEDLFDPTRATGGERYQGIRVRLNRVRLLDAAGWGRTRWAERKCRITDDTGRQLPLRTALGNGGPPPSGWFDAVGVLNQESGSGTDGTFGYELFAQEVLLHDPPALQITVLSWPVSVGEFELQSTDSLGTGAWQPVTLAPVLQGHRRVVEQPLDAASHRFYRLAHVQRDE